MELATNVRVLLLCFFLLPFESPKANPELYKVLNYRQKQEKEHKEKETNIVRQTPTRQANVPQYNPNIRYLTVPRAYGNVNYGHRTDGRNGYIGNRYGRFPLQHRRRNYPIHYDRRDDYYPYYKGGFGRGIGHFGGLGHGLGHFGLGHGYH